MALLLALLSGCQSAPPIRYASAPARLEPTLPETALARFSHEGKPFEMKSMDGLLIADPVRHSGEGIPRLDLEALEAAFLAASHSANAFRSIELIDEPVRGEQKWSLQVAVNEAVYKRREGAENPDQLTLGIAVRAVSLSDGKVLWEGTLRKETTAAWTPPIDEHAQKLVRELYLDVFSKLEEAIH